MKTSTRRNALAALAVLPALPAAPSIRDARRTEDDPEPTLTLVASMNGATAITRVWEDSRACRLCPVARCSAVDNVCLVVTTRTVGGDETAMFRPFGDSPPFPRLAPIGPP